jgi:hypothetical protein
MYVKHSKLLIIKLCRRQVEATPSAAVPGNSVIFNIINYPTDIPLLQPKNAILNKGSKIQLYLPSSEAQTRHKYFC